MGLDRAQRVRGRCKGLDGSQEGTMSGRQAQSALLCGQDRDRRRGMSGMKIESAQSVASDEVKWRRMELMLLFVSGKRALSPQVEEQVHAYI